MYCHTCLNRQSTLLNIQVLCPAFATILINTYRENAELLIDGETILSREGTTQGDPLAMGMYALGILPLIRKLDHLGKQIWFADDATAGGKLTQLREWWDKIVSLGPAYGYYANPSKTWLVVKPDHLPLATEIFTGSGVNMSTEGKRHLGAAIGSRSFIDAYAGRKVTKWVQEVQKLATIAATHPQAAYATFTHGLSNKWSFLMRTILEPLEDVINLQLFPAITGKTAINNQDRELFTLPARLGGLNIPNPSIISNAEYAASRKITGPLVNLIYYQESQYTMDTSEEQHKLKSLMKTEKREAQSAAAERPKPQLSPTLRRSIQVAKEKGASSWLIALPIEKLGFSLHKSAFRDALCLRYGWQPSILPTTCVCGHPFSIDHALNCHMGGFPTIRHNESEICHDVCTEPPPPPPPPPPFSHSLENPCPSQLPTEKTLLDLMSELGGFGDYPGKMLISTYVSSIQTHPPTVA